MGFSRTLYARCIVSDHLSRLMTWYEGTHLFTNVRCFFPERLEDRNTIFVDSKGEAGIGKGFSERLDL